MRAANALSSNGLPCGSKRVNLQNCIAVRVMTKQRRVYLLAGSLLADLARRNGTPSLYFSTVAFRNAKVSPSKRKSEAATLACTVVTAANALSQQTPTDLPQVPNITSNASRGGNGFAVGKDTQPAKFLISLL